MDTITGNCESFGVFYVIASESDEASSKECFKLFGVHITPFISTQTLSVLTASTTAIISWQIETPADTKILYGTSLDCGWTLYNGNEITSHREHCDKLTKNH